ncbi:excinuclease ABC subunit A [Enterococcus sp. AZ194]|uniref:excinuclease ABC subunit UvrA n=1 Tax=Enterococcus sp. AZ194 TaxID=2774629 RepID=UPI003F1E4748
MQEINFLKQSIITEPKEFIQKFDNLPTTIEKLVLCVQNLVIHAEHEKLYGVRFSKKQTDEELLRTAYQMLQKIEQISNKPLSTLREPNMRLVGMCRDYCLLVVSFLRSQEIQARIRVGFANYFKTDIPYEDHWIVEYYHSQEKRWIRIDPQLDDIQKEHFGVSFDSLNLQFKNGFLSGAEAWKLCRQGFYHQDDFGYNKNWKGWQSVKGNLLHDFNCMIGLELLPWDLWTDLSNKKYNQLTKSEKELLDEMAEILANPNFDTKILSELVLKLPENYLPSIYSQLKILGITSELAITNPALLQEKFKVNKLPMSKIKEPVKQNRDSIYLKGARENNLKNVEVTIPKNQFTVVTGVSGSGKSSLVFDTIYQEGKHRYLENANSGTKLNEQLMKPDFDVLQGLTPTIAIEQKKGNQNPRSTIGTITGIWDYLRMLYVAIGKLYCPYCAVELISLSKTKNSCPKCQTIFTKLNTSIFNANSHTGACSDCNGLGYVYKMNPQKIVSDPLKSILDGATHYWGKLRGKKPSGNWMVGELYAIAKEERIDLDIPWAELPDSFIEHILYGTQDKIYSYEYESKGRTAKIKRPASGAVHHIQRLFREATSSDTPYMQYMDKEKCSTCQGELLGVEARFTVVYGYRLPEIMKLTIQELMNWICTLQDHLTTDEKKLTDELIAEIENRCNHLLNVGLHYLSTDRTAPTLSGGELQRVRLSNQLGNELVGITYILDEPSIGLHPRDNHLIIDSLKNLVKNGNTVIVVEHDKETMLSADYMIDVGYGAGQAGGEIVARGTIEEIIKNPKSITGQYLGKDKESIVISRRNIKDWIELNGCSANNLKNIDVEIPLNCITTVTGVSGSGKSSLIFESLVPALEEEFKKSSVKKKYYHSIVGLEQIDGYVLMDQSSIGKSIRSSIATYTNVFDDIRFLFSKTQSAIKLGFDDAYFSYNSKKGQCPNCLGIGKIKITFPYIADQWVTCSECSGKRYQNDILQITYHEKNISEILNMEIVDAITFFEKYTAIYNKLLVLLDVGLGYLKLGQSTATLSGGESQRLKLAKELGEKAKGNMLYILDEPTTGLHFKDIEKLQIAFEKLIEDGHSVLIIEHATEIILNSDWLIDIGPESGIHGGCIVATGTPEDIKQNTNSITGRYL